MTLEAKAQFQLSISVRHVEFLSYWKKRKHLVEENQFNQRSNCVH